MRLLATCGALASLLLVVASPALAADTWTTPFTGGRLLHRVTSSQDLWVLKVDLCQPGVSVRATREGERQQRTSTFASSINDAVAAVNGDFFSFSTYQPSGPARSTSSTFGGADNSTHAPLAFGNGDVLLRNDGSTAGLEDWMEHVVSGHPTILHDGDVDPLPNYTVCQERHPRTAAGLSEDRQTLFLAVVDGRRTSAIGMKCPEVAALLQDLGAHRAVNLDGGGSSTFWLKGSVKNAPSDGSERVVSNHLVVRKSTAGRGRHCPLPLYAAELDGYSPSFSPATIVLSQGESLFGRVLVKNVGAQTWPLGVRLAPTPREVASPLVDDGWISATRVVGLDAVTAPGGVGRFSFEIHGGEPGVYEQTFGMVVNGNWFSDDGGPGDGVIRLRVEVVPADAPVEPPPPEADAGSSPGEDSDDAGPAAPPDEDAPPLPGDDAGPAAPDEDEADAAGEPTPPADDDEDPAAAPDDTAEDGGHADEEVDVAESLPPSVSGGCSASGAAPLPALLLCLLGLLIRRRR